MQKKLPIIILAGSDALPGPSPAELTHKDMLVGFKGIQKLPSGTPLIRELINRLTMSGRFESPIVIGPQRIYQNILDCEIVDVEGPLSATLRKTYTLISSRFDTLAPVAITACDVLPTPEEIRRLLETSYDQNQDAHFWWQMVEAEPSALGSSAWKQSYRLRPEENEPLKNLYPGHLVIARIGALRTRVINSVLQIAYWYRNRNLQTRYVQLAVQAFQRLLLEDLQSITSFRLPLFSISIPFRGLIGYYKFLREQLTLQEFEHHVSKTLLRRTFHTSAQGRPVRFMVTDIRSFAKDIDTKAERIKPVRIIT